MKPSNHKSITSTKTMVRTARNIASKFPLSVRSMADKFFKMNPEKALIYIFGHAHELVCREKIKELFQDQAILHTEETQFAFENLKTLLEQIFEKEEPRQKLIQKVVTDGYRKQEKMKPLSIKQINEHLIMVEDLHQITRSFF